MNRQLNAKGAVPEAVTEKEAFALMSSARCWSEVVDLICGGTGWADAVVNNGAAQIPGVVVRSNLVLFIAEGGVGNLPNAV